MSLRDPILKTNQTEGNKRYHHEYAAGSLDLSICIGQLLLTSDIGQLPRST
ncbi:hypothetical protein ACFW04_011075 [Cataglyphis niger]